MHCEKDVGIKIQPIIHNYYKHNIYINGAGKRKAENHLQLLFAKTEVTANSLYLKMRKTFHAQSFLSRKTVFFSFQGQATLANAKEDIKIA